MALYMYLVYIVYMCPIKGSIDINISSYGIVNISYKSTESSQFNKDLQITSEGIFICNDIGIYSGNIIYITFTNNIIMTTNDWRVYIYPSVYNIYVFY